MLLTFTLGWASIDAQTSAAAPPESAWIKVSTSAQGQLLTKLREKLVSDYEQTAGSYDYGVVKKLRVSGTLNAQDYSDLRNASYAGTSIRKLDLSGVVDASTQALGGMTALTDVSLPPVGNYNLANPFAGNTSLKNVVVAAETYQFGSATTFNGINTLQRITFLHTTKPSLNASTFAGSNNSDPAARTVVASVPDISRGDYGSAAFAANFADVVESATPDDFAELQLVIDEASAITETSAAAEFRWTLLQQALDAAETVHDDAASSSAQVFRARLVLQTAIDKIGTAAVGLSLKVTKGAEVGLSWKNGTAQHFAEFTPHPVIKVDDLSDAEYDVYVPTVTMPYVSQNVATAVIPGQTDKVAKIFTMSAALANSQYTLSLTPLAGRVDTSLTIPGLGAGDNRGLYTNLDNTGVLNLDVGQRFDLDTIRTQQAQLDQINNLFIEPDYTFEVSGNSVATSEIGLEGRRQLRIEAVEPGISVIKVTYGPLKYLAANDSGVPGNTNWSFNGIDPQNTGLVVVDVGGDDSTFDTGIDIRNELDTYYFDKAVGERDFSFTPAAGTTVRVHEPLNVSEWGSGWHQYEAEPDGAYVVKLKGGRNVIELTNDGEVQYHVVRAKGVDVTVTNTTDPGQPFEAGDTARIAIAGIEGGIEKLAGIYNPAFSAGTKAKLTYYDGSAQIVSNEAPQYQTAITTFNVDYTFTGTSDKALTGDMFIGGLGAEWPFHRTIPLEGKPANLAAVAIGPYHFGSTPPIYVHGDQVSTVPGSPGIPTDIQVTHGDGAAEVSWTAPTATGGLPVTGYLVRYSEDGTTWETETYGTGTNQTLTGLSNGRAYEVQVAAFNRENTGSFSSSHSVTPRTVPGVPTGLVATPDHESIGLSWTAPGDGGAEITGYRVRYSTDSGQNWTVRDFGASTGATLSGLVNDTSYEVQVAAINSEGAGGFTGSVTAAPVRADTVLGSPTVRDLTKTSATIALDVDPGDLDQEVTVEYSTDPGLDGPLVSEPETVTGGAGQTEIEISLTDLLPGTTYSYRVVSEASDGETVSSGRESFRTVSNAPTVSLTAGSNNPRVGETVRLSWTADGADTVTASGNWSGSKSASGSENIVVDRPGEFVFALTAAGEGGDASTSVRVDVSLAPAALKVTAPTGLVRAGRSATVSATGLSASESYRITIGTTEVASGVASESGSVSVPITVPDALSDGTVAVGVMGSLDDRAGSTSLRVVTAKRLSLRVTKSKVRKGRTQRVTVSGLAAGEPVRIMYRGRKIASPRASAEGTVSRNFRVGKTTGSRVIKVFGITNDRTGSRTFRVVR